MKRSILIVDDEFGLADVLGDILTEKGFDVRLAINGELGLAALDEHPAELVLLDAMMPIMSGPEMLRAMRARPELAGIPVILMTALPDLLPADVKDIDVLAKPFSFRQLNELLVKHLR
jgi:DNA-binding response OmpR family regulator